MDTNRFPKHPDTNRKEKHKFHGPPKGYEREKQPRSDSKGKMQTCYPVGFKKLAEIFEQDPNDIILYLASGRSGFRELLNQKMIRFDLLELLLRVIAKACRCHHSDASLLNMLISLSASHLFGVAGPVQNLVTNLMREPQLTDTQVSCLSNLLDVIQHLLLRIPTKACHIAGVLLPLLDTLIVRHMCVPGVANLNTQLQHITNLSDETINNIRRGGNQDDGENVGDSDAVPDDFREIPLFPTKAEIMAKGRPFLRPNIVKGCYASAEHYLDVQFRLLREDFVAPLRQGISDYLYNFGEGRKNARLQDVRIYHGVSIVFPFCTKKGIVHRVYFDPTRFKRVNWQNSKRLLHGSLVCMSKDSFETCLFATVANRDYSLLEKGLIDLYFENCVTGTLSSQNDIYVMVESSAYFEAYRHVLRGLQLIQGELPMQNYIVKCESGSRSPAYLMDPESGQSRRHKYNFEALLGIKRTVDILDLMAWPDYESLGLDHSQFQALQSAITQEFSVIQGPPGTGKTYIGLQIVRLLMANSNVWWNGQPMLIVCFTNHALDQFLEGILKFQSQGLVRVGGRSSSDNPELQKCAFLRVKQNNRPHRTGANRAEVAILNEQMTDIQKNIKALSEIIRQFDELNLEFGHLCSHMCNAHFQTFERGATLMKPTEHVFMEWLCAKDCFTQVAHEYGQNITDINRQEAEYGATGADEKTVGADGLNNAEDNDSLETIAVQGEADMINEQRDIEEDAFKELGGDMSSRENIDSELLQILELITPEMKVEVEERSTMGPSVNESQTGFQLGKQTKKKMLKTLNKAMSDKSVMTYDEEEKVNNIWELSIGDRWRLYRYWKSLYLADLIQRQDYKYEQYNNAVQKLQEIYDSEDFQVLENQLIIGMTTTGAAKHQSMLQRLQPRIVVVEEAAEVMESHIVTTLSKGCEQLILIGDHKQLRPNPNVFELAREYNLDISLFERMIRNGQHVDQLEIQHRMRPEISSLLVPNIYDNLIDHESVCRYDSEKIDVKGVEGNLFFIDHDNLERDMEDNKSHSNDHEAQFLVALCQYLINQGYDRTQITILTTYTGQMFAIKKLMPHKKFHGVRVTPVDNFQGEENDIILLSLVRSNEQGKIGFLGTSNRVCVAISRAKMGFYCIGNMQLLAKNSALWKNITAKLAEQGKLRKTLPLVCQNHPQTKTQVSSAEDFKKVPLGGCKLPCETRLDCGHVCTRLCHPFDKDHEEFKCEKKCQKMCDLGHRECKKKCFMKCDPTSEIYSLRCDPCPVLVDKSMPLCDHILKLKCWEKTDDVVCPKPCEKNLPCQHECQNICGVPCTTECKVPVTHHLLCGHDTMLNCHEDVTSFLCPEMVEKILRCGHTTTHLCHIDAARILCHTEVTKRLPFCYHPAKMQCHENEYDAKCNWMITKQLSCGHTVDTLCHKQHDPETKCEQIITMGLACGHRLNVKCCERNAEHICKEIVEKELPCGHCTEMKCSTNPNLTKCKRAVEFKFPCSHVVKAKCHELQSLKEEGCKENVNRTLTCGHNVSSSCSVDVKNTKCTTPCNVPLPCGHQCKGSCYDCKAGFRHVRCKAKCQKCLPCGHNCSRLCHEPCLGCIQRCQYMCNHGRRCENKCGTECSECTLPCPWRCIHHNCTRMCFELCDRPRCDLPCPLKIACGHSCVGLCGEPCPRLCRSEKCHGKSKVFRNAPKDARFVQLQPCNHVVEVGRMDKHMEIDRTSNCVIVEAIKCPVPGCNRAVHYCPRYGNEISQNSKDLNIVTRIHDHFAVIAADLDEFDPQELREALSPSRTYCFLDESREFGSFRTRLEFKDTASNSCYLDKPLVRSLLQLDVARVRSDPELAYICLFIQHIIQYCAQHIDRLLASRYLHSKLDSEYSTSSLLETRMERIFNFQADTETGSLKENLKHIMDDLQCICISIKDMHSHYSDPLGYIQATSTHEQTPSVHMWRILKSSKQHFIETILQESKLKHFPGFLGLVQSQFAEVKWKKCPQGHFLPFPYDANDDCISCDADTDVVKLFLSCQVQRYPQPSEEVVGFQPTLESESLLASTLPFVHTQKRGSHRGRGRWRGFKSIDHETLYSGINDHGGVMSRGGASMNIQRGQGRARGRGRSGGRGRGRGQGRSTWGDLLQPEQLN